MPSDVGGPGRLGLVREETRGLGKWESCGRARGGGGRAAGGPGCLPAGYGGEGRACRREEKEFGFRGAEGRLLLLQNCGVRIQVAEGGAVSTEAGLGGLMSLLETTPKTRS